MRDIVVDLAGKWVLETHILHLFIRIAFALEESRGDVRDCGILAEALPDSTYLVLVGSLDCVLGFCPKDWCVIVRNDEAIVGSTMVWTIDVESRMRCGITMLS